MAVENPSNRPQTIKQAKAAYKSRGQPVLSEKEKRQLDRAIELDRRAWRSKEADKRKAEAAKKKAEKERQQRADLERIRLGSQRRCDRFGYKSSQMHLGAFLGKKNVQKIEIKENIPALDEHSESESFGDDDLDAVIITEAPIPQHTSPRQAQASMNTTTSATNQLLPTSTSHQNKPISTPVIEDFDSLWEDLDSSTQIARDLTMDEPKHPQQQSTSKASSFSSGDFDLTIEDMDELDPPQLIPSKLDQDRKLTPPPPLPTRPAAAMIPAFEKITMSQLERCVDDDLQLTQMDSG